MIKENAKVLLGILAVFLNSLGFGVLISFFVLFILALAEVIINLSPNGRLIDHAYIVVPVISLIGTALIATITYINYTKNYTDRDNRFKRVYKKKYSWSYLPSNGELAEKLVSIGYQDIKFNDIGNSKVITARFPCGIYDFPKIAGGLKKYEEKLLTLEIDFLVKNLLIKIGPQKWYIPTAVTYSNFYYFNNVVHILEDLFKLSEIEI